MFAAKNLGRERIRLAVLPLVLSLLFLMAQRRYGTSIPAGTHPESDRPYSAETLAPRSLYFTHSFAKRLRSFANHFFRLPSAAVGPTGSAIRQTLAQPAEISAPVSETPRNVRHLHETSVEVIEYVKLLVDYGVMHPLWIIDRTGKLGGAPTIGGAAAYVRSDPTSLIALRWRLEDVPLEARLVNAVLGHVLPLSPSSQMEHWRQQFRNLRVIWVLDGPVTPRSIELQQATDGLVRLAGAFSRMRELDPSLAILAGREEKAPSRYIGRSPDYSAGDYKFVEQSLFEAADLAAWTGDFHSALALVDEAIGFSEQRAASEGNPAEQERYRNLALQARHLSRDLAADPDAYAAHERAQTWLQVSAVGSQLLKNTIREGITIKVPGMFTETASDNGELEVTVLDSPPEEGSGREAPWLYTVAVFVAQSLEDKAREEILPVTGLPIALINTATGERRIQRLRWDSSQIQEFVQDFTRFKDVEAGTYRVELISSDVSGPSGAPSGGRGPSPGRIAWWGRLSHMGLRWGWPGQKPRSKISARLDRSA